MLWGICQHILKALSREKSREKSIFKHEIKPESQNIDLTGPRNGLAHFPAQIYVQKRVSVSFKDVKSATLCLEKQNVPSFCS